MGATLLCELGLFLLCTLLCTGHARDAVLTIEPNWSNFFIGEFVTFKCDMNGGEDTDWEYQFNKDGREFIRFSDYNDYTFQISSIGYSGKYQCTGSWKWSPYTKTSPAEGDYTNVTSVIQLKVINKTRQRGDPEESSDYNNVNSNSGTALKS
ncbi:unnamed protein product [Oreochromis niloticus]|nr:unnamed protein product [Mustela putorius furo]